MKKQILILAPLITLMLSIGIVIFSYRQQDNTVTVNSKSKMQPEPITETVQETETGEPSKDLTKPIPVETPEQVEREISEIIKHLEILHAPEPSEADEQNPPEPEEPADPIAAAWARLEYISQNPQQWGEFSSEATELMEQLTPTWAMRTEGEGEEALELLDQLTKFQDPRSAEIFVNYFRAGASGRPVEEALIAIGPPSVPLLIPCLDDNDGFFARLVAAELLGIIGAKYRQELGGAVEYIILPKLEQMTTSDPSPIVRQHVNEAISQLR